MNTEIDYLSRAQSMEATITLFKQAFQPMVQQSAPGMSPMDPAAQQGAPPPGDHGIPPA